MGYYFKIRFNEKINGRKIWYFNNTYLCDCVNSTFEKKEDCEKWIEDIKKTYGKKIESITLHKRR